MDKKIKFFALSSGDAACDGFMTASDPDGREFIPIFRSKVLAEMEAAEMLAEETGHPPVVVEIEAKRV